MTETTAARRARLRLRTWTAVIGCRPRTAADVTRTRNIVTGGVTRRARASFLVTDSEAISSLEIVRARRFRGRVRRERAGGWPSGRARRYTTAVVPVLSGRALALAMLARSLLKVIVDRLFGARTGLALFHDNYDADRLPPVDAAERAEMIRFSRCVACGRCDVGEADRIARSGGAYPGLMAVVLASTRSMPDFDAAALALEHVPEAVLAEKEDVCPTGVPFVALARFVRAKAALMHAALPGAREAQALPQHGGAEGKA